MATLGKMIDFDPAAPYTPEQEKETLARVSRGRTALAAWVPFLGHLLLKLKPQVSLKIPTAGVTLGRDLLLNPNFIQTLGDSELIGLMAHEVLHPALLVWERQGPRTVMVTSGMGGFPTSLWNIAHDYCINQIIMDFAKNPDVGPNKLSLPPGGCLDDKYKDWSAEEVYDDLLEGVKKNGKSPQIRWGQGDCSCDDGQGGKNGESDGEEGENEGNNPGGMSQSEAQRKENENFWKQSVVEASQVQEQAKGRGSLPGSIQKIVDELLNPKIYWLDLLSRWVGENGRRQDLSYRRPGRRSESVGEIMPSLVKYGVDDVCILWDTSGSMNGLEKEILPEVQGICDDLNLQPRLICIDTMIHSDTDDVSGAVEILEKGLIKGGGGSNYTPAFERLEEDHFEGVVIAFTDGDIGVPPSQPPNIKGVLWVIFRGNHSPTEKWGETIIVGEDGYVEKNRKA